MEFEKSLPFSVPAELAVCIMCESTAKNGVAMRLTEYYEAHVKPHQNPDCKCLIWTGPSHHGVPYGVIDGERVSAYALAWMVDGGMASDGPFAKTCNTPKCVCVDHIRMQSEDPMMDEREYNARLEQGFRLIESSEDEDLSDAVEE